MQPQCNSQQPIATDYLPISVIEERGVYNRIWIEGVLYKQCKYLFFRKRKQEYCVRGNRFELVRCNKPDIYFRDIIQIHQRKHKHSFEIVYYNAKNKTKRLVLFCSEENECNKWVSHLLEAKKVWEEFLLRKCEMFCKTFSGDSVEDHPHNAE